jgi:peptidoglycan/LPS O-acetylase OafA/YrhL
MSSLPNQRLDGLQMLRFFAAFAVLLEHVMHEALSFGIAPDSLIAQLEPVDFGIGVDVFFVISGFIMMHISADKFGRKRAPSEFLLRRIVRLVPLYWLFTIAMLVATVLVPGQLAHNSLNPAHAFASFGFVPWLDSTGLTHPILGLGWTLNYEMYFYAVFALMLLVPLRAGAWTIAGLFVTLAFVHLLLPASQVQAYFWTDPIILEFAFGIGLALLMQRQVTLPGWAPPVLVLLGVAGLGLGQLINIGGPFDRALTAGLPATLVVAGTVFAQSRSVGLIGRMLVLGGDASYALYLSHPFSINVVILGWQKLHLNSPWLFIAATIVVSLVVAITVHLILERPLLRRLNDALTRGVAARDATPMVVASGK